MKINEACRRPGRGGGVLPHISHIGMCRAKGHGSCAVMV